MSPFAIRGVIEGFYGNPWTQEQRLDHIQFIGRHGMNTFVYGPKDDPLVRRRWREPYDEAALARLGQVVAVASDAGIDVVYAISPGLSVRYSSAADLAVLLAKLDQVGSLGVTRFALLLDDLPPDLAHEEDRAAYPDLATAHAAFAGAAAAALGPERDLVVCPLVYHGRGDEPYLATLAAALDPRVDLLWTGREICSHVIEVGDARRFADTTGRPPLYWDNYPVNDVAMGYELHIGPYRGRDPHLWRASNGIVANGMELFEASLIPFATIADYLRDPEGYDPEASWQAAMRDVVGETDLEAFALFADNVRSSCLAVVDAPIVSATLERAVFQLAQGDSDTAGAELGALADRLLAAAAHLLRGPVRNAALRDEIRPWLDAFEMGAQALRRIADLATAGRLEADGPAELRPFLVGLRRARVRIFGDALEMTLSVLSGTMFRPGEVP